jgi:hypothetical protein
MKFQKCSIAIHPIIAELKPELLVKLMTLDHYCYPLKTYTPFKGNSTEYGPKCTLYFKKSLSKNKLRRLKELNYPRGLFVSFSNTYDNPCLIQNGHDPSYAVHLFKLEEIHNILKEIIQTLNK